MLHRFSSILIVCSLANVRSDVFVVFRFKQKNINIYIAIDTGCIDVTYVLYYKRCIEFIEDIFINVFNLTTESHVPMNESVNLIN